MWSDEVGEEKGEGEGEKKEKAGNRMSVNGLSTSRASTRSGGC